MKTVRVNAYGALDFIGNEIIYLECPAIKDFYTISGFPFFKHRDANEEACHIWDTPKTNMMEKCASPN